MSLKVDATLLCKCAVFCIGGSSSVMMLFSFVLTSRVKWWELPVLETLDAVEFGSLSGFDSAH